MLRRERVGKKGKITGPKGMGSLRTSDSREVATSWVNQNRIAYRGPERRGIGNALTTRGNRRKKNAAASSGRECNIGRNE